MTKRVAVLISGGGSNMVCLLDSMIGDHPGRPSLVLSNLPDVGGLRKAAQRGVPTEVVDYRTFGSDRKAFESALCDVLRKYQPDLICMAGFMRILSADFVRLWRHKLINIHPSLLPQYKGLNTHARALADGARFVGCTVHYVTPDLDAGQVLGQAVVRVSKTDTARTLAASVLRQEHRLYPMVLRRILQGTLAPVYLS